MSVLVLLGWIRTALASIPSSIARPLAAIALACLVAFGCWVGGRAAGRAEGELKLQVALADVERRLRAASEAEADRQRLANEIAAQNARKAAEEALAERDNLTRQIQDLTHAASEMAGRDDVCLDAGSVRQLRALDPGRAHSPPPAAR